MPVKSLLIVESPSKARTIEKYLNNEYEVIACVGHVKDLPSSKLGIDIENDFEMTLDVLPSRKTFIKELKVKSKRVTKVLIASDPDREGEAIAAHLASEIPKEKLERVEFTEITKQGVKDGIRNSREIDHNLVSAQQTRRIIDRLVGYKVSPVLWATLQKNMNFVKNALSAGRVQSSAVKLIIDRDRKRQKFNISKYYDIKASLKKKSSDITFEAKLISINDSKIASGKDFNPDTGKLLNSSITLLTNSECKKLEKKLEKNVWNIILIEEKPRTSKPKPPFTTSTIQQEASRKLRFSAKKTMQMAQQLYENGYITYMRTDSTNLSKEAIEGSRNIILKNYGKEYLPGKVNTYETNVKNAQEAHEAIRPAHKKFKEVEEVQKSINNDAAKLYELIWKRTIASQMLPAKIKQTTISIENSNMIFKAYGQVISFPGYMRVYVEGSDNPEEELANKEKVLPEMSKGEELFCEDLLSKEHSTKPAARFTEASLVKDLEANGIGRPSTFASILETIVYRGYVDRKSGQLSPTFLGLAVTQLLENHFSSLVDNQFTARMEDGLDEISRGEKQALPFMKEFYFGDKKTPGLESMLDDKVDIGKACTITLPQNILEGIEGRIGKYGPYLTHNEKTFSIPEEIYFGDLTLKKIESILNDVREDESLGTDPESNEEIWIKKGPYGHYVEIGETKKRKGIPKEYDLNKVDLSYSLKLLSLPRLVGEHPESKEEIMADYGRYGPYIKMGKSNGRITGDITPLNITVDQAVEMLKKRTQGSSELKSLGTHPKTGEDLLLKEGRYGPYISDGKFNAALKSGYTAENITLEQAIDLIDAKRVAPKKKRRTKAKKKK